MKKGDFKVVKTIYRGDENTNNVGILKEEETLNEPYSEHGIHVNQLRQWKKTALEQNA